MGYQSNRRLEELREELRKLMEAQIESLRAQTFVGVSNDELQKQDETLKRIREVSADFLLLLKTDNR